MKYLKISKNNFSIAFYLINLILIIIAISIFIISISFQKEKVIKNADMIFSELEFKVQNIITSVEYFNTSMKTLLLYKKDIIYSTQLTYKNNNGYYALDDKFPTDLEYSKKLNISGFNGIKTDKETLNEMETTILIAPILESIRKNNKDFAWIYYMSDKDFMSLYPFVPYDEVHYYEEYKDKPLVSYARPENNPQRKTFFTPLYVDAGGLGLMVTVGKPIYKDDKFLGTTDIDLTLASLSKLLKNNDLLNNKSFIYNNESQIIGANNLFKSEINNEKIVYVEDYCDIEKVNAYNQSLKSTLCTSCYYVKEFKNAPWTFVYILPMGKIYLCSFLYSLPILIFLIFIKEIKILVNKLKKYNKEIQILLHRQSKMAAMGEMMDSTAHQWLQPISLIKTRTSVMKFDYQNSSIDDEYIKEFQDDIYKQVSHITETLNEFRDFFRPNKPKQLFDAKKMVDKVLLLMKDEISKNRIDIEVNIVNDFEILGVENEFKHVLINLINNSKDAFNENKIKDRRININLLNKPDANVINFMDNAGGIPQNIIKYIFKANFTTKDEGKGTGIGLYLSHKIVHKNNGKLSVKNINDGVIFSMVFQK